MYDINLFSFKRQICLMRYKAYFGKVHRTKLILQSARKRYRPFK